MKAIILAGGFGTRLRPLTFNTPKPMVPIVNIPVLEHTINLLKNNGFTDIIMMLYYNPEVIKEYFSDGSNFHVKITYIRPEKDLGTAGCVTYAKDLIRDDFLIISGDVFTDFNLKEFKIKHRRKKSLASILLTHVNDPLRYGIIITEKTGRIKKLLEKPSWGEVFSDTINTGIYMLNPEIFNFIPEDTNFDFSKNLFPLLLRKKQRLFGFTQEGYWKDIGTLSEYRQLHDDILNEKVKCNIKGDKYIKNDSEVFIDKNSKVVDINNIKGKCIIGENTIVEENVEIVDSIIGNNCIIKRGSKIVKTIIWNNNKIGQETDIKEVVIGNNNIIEDKVYIGVGAVISDNCQIGRESIIKPEVKIWPAKKIENNSILASSLVFGERWSNKLFDVYGITAKENIDLTPEIVAKIGSAYGSTFNEGNFILTSRDYHRSSSMIERSFISGVLSTGVNIYDIGVTPLPVAKYVAKSLSVSGGIHIRKSPYNEKMIDIKFFDSSGMDISLSMEKQIESLFFKEEFRRVENEKIGVINYPHRIYEYYYDGFMNFIDKEKIKRKNFKIIIDYSNGSSLNFFPSILGELNCEVIALNAYIDEKKLTRPWDKYNEGLYKLSKMVKTLKADAGIMIDSGSQKIIIVDDKGEVLSNDKGLLMMIKLFLMKNKKSKIGIPITATKKIEEFVKNLGGELIWLKTTYHSMMTAANNKIVDFVAEEKGGYIFSDFHPAFDAMMATAKFLEFLSFADTKLSEIVNTLPDFVKLVDDIYVSWEKRGKIMKELQKSSNVNSSHIEGVEFLYKDGRVLILPDNDLPLFHILSESTTKGRAKQILKGKKNFLKKIIEKI